MRTVVYEPTATEIAVACLRIRMAWKPCEESRRIVQHATPYELPRVAVPRELAALARHDEDAS